MRRLSGPSRVARTVFQFKALRLKVAGVGGLAVLGLGVWAGPDTRLGVVLISLGTGVLASVVVAAIALEREEFAQTVLGLGVQEVFSDRRSTFPNDFWDRLIANARKRYFVLGVANHGYLRNEMIKESTQDAIVNAIAKHGVQFEFLWLDPQHRLAEIREEEEGVRGTRDDIVDSILYFWGLQQQLAADKRSLLVLKEHDAMPTCGITWSDDVLVVTHYLAQQLNLESPGYVLGPSMSLADRTVELIRKSRPRHPEVTVAYMSNYHEISQRARIVTADRVDELRTLRGQWGPEAETRKSESEIGPEAGSESETDGPDGGE
jgi:hypothetical protein